MSLVSFEDSENFVKARDMQAINPISLQRVVKKLPNKASGPDGISYDFLKQLPFEAVTQLAKLLNTMEQEALLPTQLRMVSIVMIPKNPKVERPIALTSCLYRLWNRVRRAHLCPPPLGVQLLGGQGQGHP